MRHGRAKAARKTLQYFSRTIGLKAPYSILLDATFVAALFQQKILPVKQRLDRILHCHQPNKYFIQKQAVEELVQILQGLESKNHTKTQAFRDALEWTRKECIILQDDQTAATKSEEGNDDDQKHTRKRKKSAPRTPAHDAFLKHVENSENPYIVASQDEELLDSLRQMGTVPIVRLANHTVLLLEQPSKYSQNLAKGAERKKWTNSLPEAERALVELVVKKDSVSNTQENTDNQPPRKKIKKAKGPNPLSCKRRSASTGDKAKKTDDTSSKKRRRRAQKNKTLHAASSN